MFAFITSCRSTSLEESIPPAATKAVESVRAGSPDTPDYLIHVLPFSLTSHAARMYALGGVYDVGGEGLSGESCVAHLLPPRRHQLAGGPECATPKPNFKRAIVIE